MLLRRAGLTASAGLSCWSVYAVAVLRHHSAKHDYMSGTDSGVTSVGFAVLDERHGFLRGPSYEATLSVSPRPSSVSRSVRSTRACP